MIDDIFLLCNNRLKADDLSEEPPEIRIGFPEGRIFEKLHKQRERNSKVTKLAKQKMKNTYGKFFCQVCDFNFHERYGSLGADFIEAHHTKPISMLNEDSITEVDDIALVCSNCHSMLHRKRPWLEMNELNRVLVTV